MALIPLLSFWTYQIFVFFLKKSKLDSDVSERKTFIYLRREVVFVHCTKKSVIPLVLAKVHAKMCLVKL